MVYYRLKQIDQDGKIEFSDVVITECSIEEDVVFYPNPIKSGEALMWLSNQPFRTDVQLEMTDLSGKHILSEILSKGTSEGEIGTLSPEKGMYIIRLTYPDKRSQVVKLVIE